jgi:hypothetical protein
MFKHYLTYQFALSFERGCRSLELPTPEKNELLRCSRNLAHFFNQGVQAKEPPEACKAWFVSLTYLRDCQEILERASAWSADLRTVYPILEARLERLCTEAAAGESGQLRMLG